MSHVNNRLIPNLQANQWLEAFMLAAITALLLTRFYLHLTGYPQLGGGGLHIAHMLWGGLLMMIAIIMNLAYLGQSVRLSSAIIGGAGFGLFIDELGKFITQDNNYFFRPTIALLYIIFICLFLAFRWLDQQRRHTSQEYLINALHLLEESALQNLDQNEQQRIVEYLQKADQNNPLTQQLLAMTKTAKLTPASADWYSRWRQAITDLATKVIESKYFQPALSIYFIAQAMLIIGEVIWTLWGSMVWSSWESLLLEINSLAAWGYVLSSVVASTLLVIGVMRLRRSRLSALELFQRSLLINIFLTQFFAFYQEQLSAIFGLLANLIMLAVLNYLIEQERLQTHKNPA